MSTTISRFKEIVELLAEAQAAESDAARRTPLTAAALLATNDFAWKEIFENLPPATSPAMKRELVEHAVAWARDNEKIQVFGRVVAAQSRILNDQDGAISTLREAEDMLSKRTRQERAYGHEWGVLAIAHAEAGSDRDQILRALTVGWDLAWVLRDMESLGWLAEQWAALFDRTEAVDRLKQLEEAALGWGQLGAMIRCWQRLGEAQAAERVRQQILETSRSFEEVLKLVGSWIRNEKDTHRVEAAIARAAALAGSAANHFQLAETLNSERAFRDAARRSLDRAAAVATDPVEKVHIAHAYVSWFRDSAAADLIGPRGVRPDELRPRKITLASWHPSAAALLDWLCARMTLKHLGRIAAADRGYDEDEHFAALDYIVNTGLVPFELHWHPHEVLALTSYGSDDALEVAFARTLLLLAAPEQDILKRGPSLVKSCLSLGKEAVAYGVQLFAWLCERTGHDDEGPLAFLLLALLQASQEPEDSRVAGLIRELADSPDGPLLRDWINGATCPDSWPRLSASVLPRLREAQPALGPALDVLKLPEQ